MIVTTLDFDSEPPYNLPNAMTVLPSGALVANTRMQKYIDKKEVKLLNELLGSALYNAMIAGLAAIEALAFVVKTTPDGYLIDAQAYYNGKLYKSLIDDNTVTPEDITAWVEVPDRWLKLRDGDVYKYANKEYAWNGLKDMLIPYIYSFWLRDTWDDHTNVGIVQRTAENAKVISPARRVARAYNEFSAKAGSFYYQMNTLYGYLYQNNVELGTFNDVYDNTVYTTFGAYLNDVFRRKGTMNIHNI